MEMWFKTMLTGPVRRLRPSCTRLLRSLEPLEEAPAVTAEQGKDTFVRRAKSINRARPELLGHGAPSRLQVLLRTTKKECAFEEPFLAHSRGGCSCAVEQVATMPPAWTVMGRRWKTAMFVQEHNKLAARRGAPLATINPPRTRSSTRALQEYRRACCNDSPRDAHLRVTMCSDSSRPPRRGAASKLRPLPPVLLARKRQEIDSMHCMYAALRAAGVCALGE